MLHHAYGYSLAEVADLLGTYPHQRSHRHPSDAPPPYRPVEEADRA